MIDASLMNTRTPIEAFSIKYANSRDAFITEDIFPPVIVNKTATKKYQYDFSNLRLVADLATSKDVANRVDYAVFSSSLNTQLHKLAGEIDPHDERNADAPVADIQQDTAANVMERLLLNRESAMATAVSTSASYPAGLTSTLGAGVTWASAAGDPEGDAKTAAIAVKQNCGQPPDSLALSWTALQYLKQSPALKDRLKYTSGQSVTEEQIKNLLMVKNLFVASSTYNTAGLEGGTDALGDIWDDFALFFVQGKQALRTMSYGNMYLRNNLYTWMAEDPFRGSGDGRIKILEMGWEYQLAASAIDTAASGKFIAGYYLDNIY